MLKRFKKFLWSLGLYGVTCPFCHQELTEHGFNTEEKSSDWTCKTFGCVFNK